MAVVSVMKRARDRIQERRKQLSSQSLFGIKYILNPVTSPTVGITAGQAFADILAFNVPLDAGEGTVIDGPVLVKNTGDTGVNIDVNYWWVNGDKFPPHTYNEDLGWSGRQYLASGEQKWFPKDALLTMPAGDVWLKARSFVSGAWPWDPGTWSEDLDATVELRLLLNATLTLAISPTTVRVGMDIQCSGRLTRNDTGAGVATANITIEFLINGTWTAQKSGTANVDGNYLLNVAAPSTSGNYSVRATYAGSAMFGQTISKQTMLGVEPGNAPSPQVNAYCQAPMLIRNNYYRAKKFGLVNVQRKLEDLATRQGYSLV